MTKHKHLWKNDEVMESGAVIIVSGKIDALQEEMRQTCTCGEVRYVKKKDSRPFSLLDDSHDKYL